MKPHILTLCAALLGLPAFGIAQNCLPIAGNYTFVETGTLTLTILPSGGTDRCTFTERGTVRITQSGCSVVITPTSSGACSGCESGGFDLGCNPKSCSGTVNSNRITLGWSQYWPLPSQIESYILSRTRSASGTISGNRIVINATGRVDTDLPINDGVRFTWSSRWVLDRILDCPNISIQPSNRTVYAGGTVSFEVIAGHTQPLTYQWRRNGVNLPGETSPILTLRNVGGAQAGNYTVLVRNLECTVTSVVAKLTVNVPPPAGPPWREDWQSATAGCRIPSDLAPALIETVNGRWYLGDTATTGDAQGNRACIVTDNGSNSLQIISVPNPSVAENVFLAISPDTTPGFGIPLLPGTQIAFTERGALEAPRWNGSFPCAFLPCGNTTHLMVGDDRGNQVAYIFQRATNYVEHAMTNGVSVTGYLEVFLDPAGGTFTRNLYDDFARVAGVAGVGGTVRFLEFEVGAAGWATLDDLKIGRELIDASAPTVVIAAPANNARSSNSVLTVTGTAGDNRGVAAVLFQVGDTPFQAAQGTIHWSAAAPLEPGTNIFRVKSVDADGNESVIASRRFVRTVPLSLSVSEGGRVLGAVDGQFLEVHRRFTLSAVPAAGYLFSNWTGGVLSSSNPVTFVMTPGLVVEANFVPNPFLDRTGAYHGLFFETNGIRHGSSGSVKAQVRGTGGYTVSLRQGGRLSGFTGRFGLDGKATNRVLRPGTNALTVELCLDLQGAGRITGRVTDGAWTADLRAERAVFNLTSNPATHFAGRYTLLLPGATNGLPDEPAGHGYQTLVVSRAGLGTFAGVLADGTPAALQVPLSEAGEVPWYVSLYGGRGSALGWMRVRPSAEMDLEGLTAWLKPPLPLPPRYTNGFALVLPVVGSAYAPPGINRLLHGDAVKVVLAGGGLIEPLTNSLALGPGGRVTNAGPHRLTFQAALPTGLFNGALTPTGQAVPISFKGVLLQRQGVGGGFFLRNNQSGAVYVGP